MRAELQLLARLKQAGYFERGDFDPEPVFQVCRVHFGLDIVNPIDREQIYAMIDCLTADGLARFEYSSDPKLHPKDTLDYWRLVLTALGGRTLQRDHDDDN